MAFPHSAWQIPMLSGLFDHNLPWNSFFNFLSFPLSFFLLGNSEFILQLFQYIVIICLHNCIYSTGKRHQTAHYRTENSNDLWTSETFNLSSNWGNTNSDHNHATPVRMTKNKQTKKPWSCIFQSIGEAVERWEQDGDSRILLSRWVYTCITTLEGVGSTR